MREACEVWEPTYEEKLELYEAWLLGWDEAGEGYRCDPPMDGAPIFAREYVRGWTRRRFEVAAQRPA